MTQIEEGAHTEIGLADTVLLSIPQLVLVVDNMVLQIARSAREPCDRRAEVACSARASPSDFERRDAIAEDSAHEAYSLRGGEAVGLCWTR